MLKHAKDVVDRRILKEIKGAHVEAPVLDFGCGFGNFLGKCRAMQIQGEGFEAYDVGAKEARSQGFRVHEGWEIENARLSDNSYRAIVAIDSFYYCWNPFAALRMFFRLLMPGGRLIMRITNKRWLLRWLRNLMPAGEKRDYSITGVLQGQFHSVSVPALCRVLAALGFQEARVLPRAYTDLFSRMPWHTRLAYGASDILYLATFAGVNLYPGVIVVGDKPKISI